MKTKFLILILLTISIITPVNSFAEKHIKVEDDFWGSIKWISQCNLVVSTSIVRVTDYDMNKDPKKIEQLNVEVWSNSENRTKDYAVIETDMDTGIFDATIFLTFDETPGKRVQTYAGDTVFAKYVDYTLPNTFKEKAEIVDTFVMSDVFALGQKGNVPPLNLTYDSCTKVYLERFPERANQHVIFYPSPLKQIKSGILIDEIQCKQDLILIQKQDESPACVNLHSIHKLFERSWMNSSNISQFKEVFCELNNGKWSKEFHNCVGGSMQVPCDYVTTSELKPPFFEKIITQEGQCISHEKMCSSMGGTVACMSYEQLGHGRDICTSVCEFD